MQHPTHGPLAALRRFVRSRTAPPRQEQCAVCAAPLPPEHPHLLDRGQGKIACACVPCALLFEGQDSPRFKRVARDVYSLPGFTLTDAAWQALGIPVGLAFICHTPARGATAHYPSPAGAVESSVAMEAWSALLAASPVLATRELDVEALLVRRVDARQEAFLAPIDECYRLVGLIRTGWQGLSGGPAVSREVEAFFDLLRQRSRPFGATANA